MGKLLTIHDVDDVRLDDYERPEAGPKDVVVKMKACGICGSDLSYIKFGGIPTPGTKTALGHEGAGEVMQVGADVQGLSPGDPVIVNPMMTPSFIGSGGPEGAFTEELLVRDGLAGTNLLPIPEGVPYDVAAMCEPLAVAMHGVNRAEARAGDKIVIFGCGPIGLGMVLWAVDRGCNVVALDLAESRRERAKALGATVFDPRDGDLFDLLKDVHGEEKVFGKPCVGTDAFIDAAGAPSILADVISVGKSQARHVITAAYMKPIEFPAGAMLTREMTITTAVGYPTEMPEVIAAMPRLKDKIEAMISHRLPFAQVLDGLELAGTPDSAKVMIEFGDA